MRTVSCTVGPERDGQPVWQVLREQLGLSDRGLRRAKRVPGAILLDGIPARTTMPVRAGQTVSVAVDDATVARNEPAVAPEPGPLAIVYEDDDLVVVDKPAGQVVHPCSGKRSGTLGNYLVHHLLERGAGGVPCATSDPGDADANPGGACVSDVADEGFFRLHPVHRLDAGTSGLVVFAVNGYAQVALQNQLHAGGFLRTYLAVCRGVLPQVRGVVDVPIARVGRGPRSFDVAPDGKRAVTHYRVLATFTAPGATSKEGRLGGEGRPGCGRPGGEALSLVELHLETGRTHQIRVHMAHLGNPLLGDAAYGAGATGGAPDDTGADVGDPTRREPFATGGAGEPAQPVPAPQPDRFPRPALHSWRLSLTHPVTGAHLDLEAPLPADLRELLEECEILSAVNGPWELGAGN